METTIKLLTLPMEDVQGKATITMSGDADEVYMALTVNDVYYALPDNCVIEVDFDEMLIELHMRQTSRVAKG